MQSIHAQHFKAVMRSTVLALIMMSVPQMMIVNMIGYVAVMDVEDVLVLTLLKCVK